METTGTTDLDRLRLVDELNEKYKLVNCSLPITFRFLPDHVCGFVKMTVFLQVLDRDTGEKTVIRQHRTFSVDDLTLCNVIDCLVRNALVDILRHEVNECLLVSGARVFDEHW